MRTYRWRFHVPSWCILPPVRASSTFPEYACICSRGVALVHVFVVHIPVSVFRETFQVSLSGRAQH